MVALVDLLYIRRVATNADGSEMSPQSPTVGNETDPPRAARKTETPGQADDATSKGGAIESPFQALQRFREKLKQSSHRPRWWSDHLQNFHR